MPVLMPNPVFRWFVPAQNGTGLVPAAGYKAKFYAAGTSTAKTIYEIDNTPYPSPANTAVLNSQGYAEIKLGPGGYKLRVTDADDNVVYTQDNINGDGSFGTGFVPTVIATDFPATNGLAQLDSTSNRFTWCAGYYAIGDGGHGFFWNETSSTPDDTGYVIASTFDPTKRWFRVPDESGDVRAASFGYIGSKAGNLSSQLLAASSYANGYGKRLVIGPGNVAVIGSGTADFYLYASSGLYLEPSSMLTGTGLFTNLVIVGPVTGSPEQHFTGFQAQLQTIQLNQNPEWFGGSYGSLDNTAAFTKWFASLPFGGAFLLPPGVWKYTNTTAFPYPTVPFLLLGSIDATVGSDIPTGAYFPGDSRFRFYKWLFPNGATITDGGVSTIAVVGDITLAGQLTATGQITTAAGYDINSGRNVIAGFNSSPGYLLARAGSGITSFKAGGQFLTLIQTASTTGTGATNLLSTVLPANSFLTAGDHLRVMLSGIGHGGSAQNKTIAVTIGATSMCSHTKSFQDTTWSLQIDIWLKSTAAVYATSIFTISTDIVTQVAAQTFQRVDTTSSLSFSTNQTLQVVGTAAVTGSIDQSMLSIEYFPANP